MDYLKLIFTFGVNFRPDCLGKKSNIFQWVFIFNSKTGQWGVKNDESTTEEPANDVLRVTVKPQQSATMNERMKFVIDSKGFALEWEHLKVPVSVK